MDSAMLPAPALDRADYDFLMDNGALGQSLQLPCFIHLTQPVGVWNYIRIAGDIVRQTGPCCLLDWGCGYGQMTYLLRRRGLEVTPFDLGTPGAALPDLPLTRQLQVVRSLHPTDLPFDSGSFDAVLSCGVLEHVDEESQVGNELKSLSEIRRVLKPGGFFLIYQLPQRDAWQEALIRRYKTGYSHPRRFTSGEITRLLAYCGFRVRSLKRANLFPKNLPGVPDSLRRLYNRFPRALIALDESLCHLPGLNRYAGVLEITATSL